MHKRILVRLQVGNAKGTELPSVGETTKDLKAQDNDVRRGAVGRGGVPRPGHFCCTLRSLCQLKCTSDALLLLRPAGKFILTKK